MPIDPRELRSKGTGLFEIISEDRLCDRCRYNLKGLPSNGKCPECGFPIRRRGRSKRFVDNLVDAPSFYLRTLALGLWLMAGAIAVVTVSKIIATFAVFSNSHVLSRQIGPLTVADLLNIATGFVTLVWWVGVYIVTAQRPLTENTLRDALLESWHLRTANRILQAFWALGALLFFLHIRTLFQPVQTAAYLSLLIAVFGLIPLAIQMSSLADWASDTGLSERFKVSAWAMALFGLFQQAGSLISSLGGPLSGLITMLGLWSTLFDAIAQGVFLFSVYQLAAVATWAIRNASAASNSARRLAQQQERHERDMLERTNTAAALMKHGAAPVRKVRPTFGENIVPRPAAPSPYKVDPSTSPPKPHP